MPVHGQTFVDNQVACITQAIYYEAGNQKPIGKEAVAFVIFNRAQKYNLTPCEVINQKIGGHKQFTWNPGPIKYWGQYLESYQIARDLYWNLNSYQDPTRGALYFHAYYVHPKWHGRKTIRIQDHIFYA
jgi:spore germination cell wall hydrolase CwlJ-like protein